MSAMKNDAWPPCWRAVELNIIHDLEFLLCFIFQQLFDQAIIVFIITYCYHAMQVITGSFSKLKK